MCSLKIAFVNAGSLADGISLVADELDVIVVERDQDLTVTVCEIDEAVSEVFLDGAVATVRYGGGKARFFRALARLIGWLGDGKTQGEIRETKEYPHHMVPKSMACAESKSGGRYPNEVCR